MLSNGVETDMIMLVTTSGRKYPIARKPPGHAV